MSDVKGRQRKALLPVQATAPEAAEGKEVRRDDERRAALEGVGLGGERMEGYAPSRSRTISPFPLFLLSSADWGKGD